MRILIALAAAAIAAPAAAQTATTIDPGMTRAQVVAKLGEPLSVRTYDGHTYLLYKNGCEKKCGMNDLVVLDSGKVIDAVFRSPARHYSGTSSSPRMMSAVDAKRETASPLTVPDTTAKKPEMPAKKADTTAKKPDVPAKKPEPPAKKPDTPAKKPADAPRPSA